jgi:hypothetical protein
MAGNDYPFELLEALNMPLRGAMTDENPLFSGQR